MEENFSMEWKIFGMEWKWNGRKLPVWNMEKLSSIPFHTVLWFAVWQKVQLYVMQYKKYFVTLQGVPNRSSKPECALHIAKLTWLVVTG